MQETFSVTQTSRSTPPRILYEDIAAEILPKKYELSLVFIGDTLARKLNKERRGKTYAANVLTFPLSEQSGEIFINLAQAKKQAVRYGISYRQWVLQLFIHGLLHLKGMHHGATMESTERTLVKRYS